MRFFLLLLTVELRFFNTLPSNNLLLLLNCAFRSRDFLYDSHDIVCALLILRFFLLGTLVVTTQYLTSTR